MQNFKKWNPKNYLKQYYSLDYLVYDEELIFRFIYKLLKKKKKKYTSILDFGAGPTIHRMIPFIPLVGEVYISDYLSSNLREIDHWINSKQNAHNWFNQIKHILEIEVEGNTEVISTADVEKRIEFFRRKKIFLIKGDIFKKNPLPIQKKFSLVTSFYCADSIVKSKEDWKSAMINLLSLVEPGGLIIIAALRKTNKYKVGQHFFPSPNLHERDLSDIMYSSGFEKKKTDIQIISADEWQDEGINSLMLLSSEKKYEV